MKTFKRFMFAMLPLLFLFSNNVEAQPNLNFKRVISGNWPTIELYFSVSCNGKPAYFTDPTFFKVYENGVEVGEWTLWCPDPQSRCAISVALVFDASGSMMGPGQAGAIAAGNAFIDLMDGISDEAAIIWFNSTVTVYQGMTISKGMLHTAINNLPASGATAVWDGIYAGLQELIANGSNQCRAVIALTDGGDNSSTRTPSEVITLANRNRIRVFTIGLGTGIDAALLQAIADQTGGRYYQTPSGAELTRIYEEISTIILQGFQECVIMYQAKCMDGSTRTVDLQLLNFCGGNDTKTKTYKALKDTSTYEPLNIRVAKKNARGNSTIKVPIELLTPIINDNLYTASFEILYDEGCMSFQNISTKGTLLDGIGAIITPFSGGIKVQTMDKKIINGYGTLFELTFKTSDPEGKDTICCPIEIRNWIFDAGCFRPVIENGEVCIIPRQPNVRCELYTPVELTWVRSLKDYSPNPFTITMMTYNEGDREARNVSYKITYNTSDFTLVAPTSSNQMGNPRNIDVGELNEVRWELLAKRRLVGDTVEVCITAMFDNHEDVKCCKKIYIPAADAVLKCSALTPTIVADNVNLKYNPMPFSIDVLVTNEGGKKTDTCFATIILPNGLSLAGPDAPNKNTKKILPAILNPGQTGGVSFTLSHPITLTTKNYIVGVWVKTSNADSTYCEVEVIIPPLNAPVLSPRCSIPDSLHFDESLDSYVPNPFNVTLTTVNSGGLPATNVSAFIYLPDGVTFANGSETNRKIFVPSTMNQYTGGPMPTLTWNVVYNKRLRYNTTLTFKFVVGGVGPTGQPLDSVETYCEMLVPGLMPSFNCDLIIPDSLGINQTETNVEPNPFTITYKVFNTSKQTAKISTINLYLPSNGVTLHPSTPNSGLTLNQTLKPGDTLTVSWIVNVQNQTTRRNLYIQVIAFDDEGNQILCSDNLPIANLKTALMCLANVDNEYLTFNPILQKYDIETVKLTALLTNSGAFPLNNVEATLEYDTTYFMLDNDVQIKTLPLLFIGQTEVITWNLKLRQYNVTGSTYTATFNVTYKSKETPQISSGCDAYVAIEPVSKPKLVCSLNTVDTIRFNQIGYSPTAFYVDFIVQNIGTATARNTKIYLLQNTRFIMTGTMIFDLGNIVAGSTFNGNQPNSFRVKITPRYTDGYDTLRAIVVSDGTDPVICEYIIFVEKVRNPKFTINCDANITVVFDQAANDYNPNMFSINVTTTNVGDVVAYNCDLVYIGSKNIVPIDNAIKFIGTMYPNSTESRTWTFKILQTTYSRWDTLKFEIHGYGGLGERLTITTCETIIFVPGTLSAKYDQECFSEQIRFDNTSGVYVPDPFKYTTKIKNVGMSIGQDLVVTINVPSGLMLSPGETAVKTIPILAKDSIVEVSWLLKPIVTYIDLSTQVCVDVKDKFNNSSTCCSEVLIPKANKMLIDITCNAPDKMIVSIDISNYENNPFVATARITNTSQRTIDSVYVVLIATDNMKLLSQPQVFVAMSLDPGVSKDVQWDVYVKPSFINDLGKLTYIVYAKDISSIKCTRDVYIPAIPQADVQCNVEVVDVITFNNNTGMYNGQISQFGNYTTNEIKVTVSNNGDGVARDILINLLLPQGLILEQNQIPFELISKLSPRESKTFTWNVYPIRTNVDELKQIRISIQQTLSKYITYCGKEVIVEGAPKTSIVYLPSDVVSRFGENIVVPLYISKTIGNSLNEFEFHINYDRNVIRFTSAQQYNIIKNWTKFDVYDNGNKIIINAKTTSNEINSINDEVFLLLNFVPYENPVTYVMTNLVFDTLNSKMNQGEILTTYIDGKITISNDCIVPLVSTYELKQNKPNPFIETTSIEYTLGDDGYVIINVYDILGNIIDTPVKTNQKKGDYVLHINANNLINGTYYYSINVNGFHNIKKMIILK